MAEACPTASFARFDFAAPSGQRYTGTEKVTYFIGRVLVFYEKTDPPSALIFVAREYPETQGRRRIPKLPDIAHLKMRPFGNCIGPVLREEMIGLFEYYEKDGELWLAWEKGQFY